MKSPKDMKIIQIEITNACVHRCSNCTRFCGHHKKPFFMDYPTFTQAVDSMAGFRGIVGVMGGEPTLHPKFGQFVEYFRAHFDAGDSPKALRRPTRDFTGYVLEHLFDRYGANRRGLWSSLGRKYYEHFECIQDCFGYQALNDHINPSMHETLTVTRKELGVPDDEWIRLRDACWIQNIWSASITPKGAFFCEVAAAMDMLFDGPGGWPIEPGWWQRTPAEFADQLHWCELCSAPLAMPKRDARDGVDDVSPVWYEKLREIDSPKLRKGRVHRFDVSSYNPTDHEVINEALPYMQDQVLRIGESNKSLFPQTVEAVVLLDDTLAPETARRIVDDSRRDVELIAVVSTGEAHGDLAREAGVPLFSTLRQSGRQIWESLAGKMKGKDWLLVLDRIAPSPTLARCFAASVHNPGCVYLGPDRGEQGGSRRPGFLFCNTRAQSLRGGADLLDLPSAYPADKVVRLDADLNRRVKIFLSYHKDTVRIENDVLTPIHVGRANAAADLDMLGDDTGDNISDTNHMYAELTAQYWAWKNDCQSDYLGFMHYRRVFIFDEGHEKEVNFEKDRVIVPSVNGTSYARFGWREADIVEALEGVDILLPLPYRVKAGPVRNCREHFIHHHGKENYSLLRELVDTYCPEYREEAEEFFAGDRLYLCNMFVMRRDLFENYCTWLFDVLAKVEPHLTPDRYDAYQIRMPAYIAERLFNLYVRKLRREEPQRKVNEVPYALIENVAPAPRPLLPLTSDRPVVTIVTAFDAAYAPYFAASFASMLEQFSADRYYDVIVLEDDVPSVDKQHFEAMANVRDNVQIRYISMAGHYEGASHAHFTKSTFNRLKLPELLPEHSKAVYIDPDTIVLKDLGVLFDHDVDGYYAGAVVDYSFKFMTHAATRVWPEFGGVTVREYLANYLELSETAIDAYFNAGVMLFNLDQIRADGLGGVFDALFARKSYYCVDQDIMNKAFGGRVLHLDARWNVIIQPLENMSKMPWHHFATYQQARNDPFIVHYAGLSKPWNSPDMEFAEQFWARCRKTPYYEKVLISAYSAQKGSPRNGRPHGGRTPRDRAMSRHAATGLKVALGDRLYRVSPKLWGVCQRLYHKVIG